MGVITRTVQRQIEAVVCDLCGAEYEVPEQQADLAVFLRWWKPDGTAGNPFVLCFPNKCVGRVSRRLASLTQAQKDSWL